MDQDRGAIDQARSALTAYTAATAKYEKTSKSLGNVSSAIGRWMGFYQVLNLTKSAIQEMKTHV